MKYCPIPNRSTLSLLLFLIDRFEFGELKNFTNTTHFVFHIEVDATNSSRLIFAVRGAIQATDGQVTTTVTGSTSETGYQEGIGQAARFYYIRDFVQEFRKQIIVLDSRNHCLRLVHRPSMQTEAFAGKCETFGFTNGNSGLFYYPSSILRDVHSNGVYVTDSYNNALRYVDLITRVISTVLSTGVRRPDSVAFGFNNKTLLLSNYHYISRYDIDSQTLVNITGDPGRAWHVNGNLATARFFYPRELLPLNGNVTLLADFNNNRLRIIDEGANNVSSICAGRRKMVEGPAATCQLLQPASLLLVDNVLYVGAQNAILTLPGVVKLHQRIPCIFT